MTSDRTRRVRRCYMWGFGAVLATAGLAAAQQSNATDTYKPGQDDQSSSQSSSTPDTSQSGWRRAQTIPQLRDSGVVVLVKDENSKSTEVTIQDGRIVGAEIDNQFISPDHVEVQGNKIRVLDNNNQVAATFRVPHLSNLAMGRGRDTSSSGYNSQYNSQYSGRYGTYGTNEPPYGQGYSQNYNQGYGQNYNQGYGQYQDRYSQPGASQYGSNYQQDQWNRNYNQGQYSQGYQGQYGQDQYRQYGQYNSPNDWQYQNRYGQSGYNQNYPQNYNNPGYAQGNYEQGQYGQPGYNQGNYDRNDMNRWSRNRNYGASENYRGGAMPLGVMTTEAQQSDLNTSSGTTKYTQGIKVERVQDDMPAANAGLQKGDIIVSIDGQTPATSALLRQELQQKQQGDTLNLVVLRNGSEKNVNVKVQNVDRSKYNWDYMGSDTTVDHGNNTLPDQKMLQPNNRQEVYQPGQSSDYNRNNDNSNTNTNNRNPR